MVSIKIWKKTYAFFRPIRYTNVLLRVLLTLYLGIDKLFLNTTGRLITERPQFYIALVSMLLGTQFFLAGFIGEIILRNKPKENTNYTITENL